MRESGQITVLNGAFGFKRLADGTVDKSVVICRFCRKEFSYHRSSSSLKYHLNAKHFAESQQLPAPAALHPSASSEPPPAALHQPPTPAMSESVTSNTRAINLD